MARAGFFGAWTVVVALALPGCGGGKSAPPQELSFEKLRDTTGLSQGAAIVERFEPYRMPNGAVRVTGRARLPDGTKLEIAIRRPGSRVAVALAHVFVRDSQFDTPPLLGENGPLPEGEYRLEVLAHFNADWQRPDVLRAIGGGLSLRGPGITRERDGAAALYLAREERL